MKNGRKPQQHPNANVAVGYKRVSTEEQGISGLGLMDQHGAIMRYCQYARLSVLKVCEDDMTGKVRARPGLDEALSYIRNGEARILVIKELSRLSRNLPDLCHILDEIQTIGADLFIIDLNVDTRTATGMMIFQIVGAVAQMTGKQISEKTRDAMAQIPRNTTHTDKNGKLKNPPGRQIMVTPTVHRQIVMLHRQGRSQRDIAKILNEQGEPSPLGKGWERGVIRRVLDREAEGRATRNVQPATTKPDYTAETAERELDELAAMTDEELDAVAASVPA